jgi:hypothetical protein
MDSGLVVMSRREIERAHVMRAIRERRLAQKQAASQLVLSVRQAERLFARYKRIVLTEASVRFGGSSGRLRETAMPALGSR